MQQTHRVNAELRQHHCYRQHGATMVGHRTYNQAFTGPFQSQKPVASCSSPCALVAEQYYLVLP